MIDTVHEHGPAPLQDLTACDTHIQEYQDMLRHVPPQLALPPGFTGPDHKQIREHVGSTQAHVQPVAKGLAFS